MFSSQTFLYQHSVPTFKLNSALRYILTAVLILIVQPETSVSIPTQSAAIWHLTTSVSVGHLAISLPLNTYGRISLGLPEYFWHARNILAGF